MNNVPTLILIEVIFLMLAQMVFGQDNKLDELRHQMVKKQIEARGVSNKDVLEAFLKVPRHQFVLPEYLALAYADRPLPIAEGQTISQPYIVAFMTEALQLQPSDRVLEIGTGSGYQAAILAELCNEVYTIEIFESLAEKATQIFGNLDYKNIHVKTGDGYKGWTEYAPFNAIIVTCSPTHIPAELKEQLAENGRMIIPVGLGSNQKLVLLNKQNGKVTQRNVLPVRFVPMIDSTGTKY